MTVIALQAPTKLKTPKLTPEQKLEMAETVLFSARVIAKFFSRTRKEVMGKRKGDPCMIVRGALNYYLIGLGYPVRAIAEIEDVDRNQPSDDAEQMQAWAVRNPYIEKTLEDLTSFLDYARRIAPKDFIKTCIAELEADRKAKAEARKARKEAEEIAAIADDLKAKGPIRRNKTEAEHLAHEGQRVRYDIVKARSIKICEAVIAKGEEPGANKEARNFARKARLALEEINGAGVMERAKSASASKEDRAAATKTKRALQEIVGGIPV